MSRLLRLFLPALSFAFGIAVMLLFFHHGVAYAASAADPVPSAMPQLSWQAWIAIGLAGLAGLRTIVDACLAFFKAEAPLTKTTLDDRARDEFQKLHDRLDKFATSINGLVDASKPVGDVPVLSVAKTPGAGTVGVLAILLLGALVAPALTGCAAAKSDAAAIAAGVVTCAKGDIPAAQALGLQLGTEALADLLTGKTSAQIWTQVSTDAEAAAKTQGLAVASCGFGGLVAELDKLLHPAPAAGTATQSLTVSAAVDPIAGGRAALAAFAAAHQITRIDP